MPLPQSPYPPSRGVLIDAQDVERKYVSGSEVVYALRGVTLQVHQGEYVSLMGPSGSGKTTFFNLIGALDNPTRGTLLLGNRDMNQLSSAQLASLRCKNIGYIFQNYNLVETLSAVDNVALPMRLLGVSIAEAKQKASELLSAVGLGHRLTHRPAELSGGQQQRVAIARSLANGPSLLLADEPTGNLDTKTSKSIVELLSRLSRDRGVTVVTATHDHQMLDVSDRIVYLRDGAVERIVAREDMEVSVGKVAE